ncbi:MAG: hypothetical protein WCK16_00855 [Candidatus Moraniibacteriota bacterium]
MEKFSPELVQAQTEALDIQKKAKEEKEKKGEVGSLSNEDYENACLPRVESYEKFLEENTKLESFVDHIEQNSPNGEINIYSPEFWYSYQKFIETVWTKEGLAQLNSKDYEDFEDYRHDSNKMRKPIDHVFSNGASIFRGNEHFNRIKQRSLLNTLNKNGISTENLQTIKDSFAHYYRSDGGYGPKNISKSALEQSYLQRIEAVKKLNQSQELSKITEIWDEYGLLDSLSSEVSTCFGGRNETPIIRKIREKHKNSFKEKKFKEIELAIVETITLNGLKDSFLLTKEYDKLIEIEKKDPNLIKSAIAGTSALTFVVLTSNIVSTVVGDAYAYTPIGAVPNIDSISREMKEFCCDVEE